MSRLILALAFLGNTIIRADPFAAGPKDAVASGRRHLTHNTKAFQEEQCGGEEIHRFPSLEACCDDLASGGFQEDLTEFLSNLEGSSLDVLKGECVANGFYFPGQVPTPSPTPTPAPVACHPASALVVTAAGPVVRVDQLQIGDAILGPAGPTLVLGFLHRSPTLVGTNYRTLATASGDLTLSPEHVLPVNGVDARADTAEVGDTVSTDSGPAAITDVTVGTEYGAYHLFVEADYYYVKNPGSTAAFAASNMLRLDDDGVYTDISWWYVKCKECYAAGRPMNADPNVSGNMTKAEFYDCANFPLVSGLQACATCV